MSDAEIHAATARELANAGAAGADEHALISIALSAIEIARTLAEVKDVLFAPETVTEPPEECPYEANHPNIRRSGRPCPICGRTGNQLA